MSRMPDAVGHVHIELGLYALGALSREETALVEKHLHGCPSCTKTYDFIRDIPRALARVSPEDIAHLLATSGEPAATASMDRTRARRRSPLDP